MKKQSKETKEAIEMDFYVPLEERFGMGQVGEPKKFVPNKVEPTETNNGVCIE